MPTCLLVTNLFIFHPRLLRTYSLIVWWVFLCVFFCCCCCCFLHHFSKRIYAREWTPNQQLIHAHCVNKKGSPEEKESYTQNWNIWNFEKFQAILCYLCKHKSLPLQFLYRSNFSTCANTSRCLHWQVYITN